MKPKSQVLDAIDQPPNPKGYDAYMAELSVREVSNSETYDLALLTLSTALLALSLTFIRETVPMGSAIAFWLLYSAWGFFAFSAGLTLASFMYGQYVIRQLKEKAKPYFLEGQRDLVDTSEKLQRRMQRIKRATGASFLLGLTTLTSFMTVNIHKEATEAANTRRLVTIERGQRVPAEQIQAPPQEQPTAPVSQPAAPTATPTTTPSFKGARGKQPSKSSSRSLRRRV